MSRSMQPGFLYCPRCGRANHPGSRACASCGAYLVMPPPPSAPPLAPASPPPSPPPTRPVYAPPPAPPLPNANSGGYLHPVHGAPRQGSSIGRDLAIILGVIVVAGVLIVAILAATGFFGGFGPTRSFQGTTSGANCAWTPFHYSFPNNAPVRFIWSVQNGGGSQELTVTGPGGSIVYDQSGMLGSGSFTAASGPYAFSGTGCTSATIQVSGFYN